MTKEEIIKQVVYNTNFDSFDSLIVWLCRRELTVSERDFIDEIFHQSMEQYAQYQLKQKQILGDRKLVELEHQLTVCKTENTKLFESKDKEMIDFAWWFFTNLGRYSDDQVAHFEGSYLEEWKKIQTINQSKDNGTL